MSNPVSSLNSVMHIYIGFIGSIQLCILANVLFRLCRESKNTAEKYDILHWLMLKHKTTIFYSAGVWDFHLAFFLSNEILWITEGRRNKVWIIRVSNLFFTWKENKVSPEERIRQDWEKEETLKCLSLWYVQIYSVNV